MNHYEKILRSNVKNPFQAYMLGDYPSESEALNRSKQDLKTKFKYTDNMIKKLNKEIILWLIPIYALMGFITLYTLIL